MNNNTTRALCALADALNLTAREQATLARAMQEIGLTSKQRNRMRILNLAKR